MQDPLKQGLKRSLDLADIEETRIRMQDPLKQGLKRYNHFLNLIVVIIRMQDPLKQGLKHRMFTLLINKRNNSNARSTKTRIETPLRKEIQEPFYRFECKIH